MFVDCRGKTTLLDPRVGRMPHGWRFPSKPNTIANITKKSQGKVVSSVRENSDVQPRTMVEDNNLWPYSGNLFQVPRSLSSRRLCRWTASCRMLKHQEVPLNMQSSLYVRALDRKAKSSRSRPNCRLATLTSKGSGVKIWWTPSELQVHWKAKFNSFVSMLRVGIFLLLITFILYVHEMRRYLFCTLEIARDRDPRPPKLQTRTQKLSSDSIRKSTLWIIRIFGKGEFSKQVLVFLIR